VKNRLALAAVALVVLVPLAACSSDSSTSSTSTTASSGSQVTDTNCPFTGTTGQSSGGTAGTAAALSTITTSKQGCVDNIQLKMTGGVGAWTVAYATGPVTDASGATIAAQGAASLVVTIQSGSWSGSPAAPTTVLPIQLDYVQSINVASGPGGTLLVVFGMSAKKPYQASDSAQTPGYISLGIG
jgi:hypothetical protein